MLEHIGSTRRFGVVVATLIAHGCADRLAGDDTGEQGSSSTAESTGGSGTSDPSGVLESSSSSESSTSSDASSGEPVAECGNGVVEADEECDGEPGCVECMRTCGFAQPVDLLLGDVSWTTSTRAPVALMDGTGDLIVNSAAGIHRVAADGEEQWLNTEATTTHRVYALAAADPEHVWVGWTVYEPTLHARYTRHDVSDGTEVDAFTITDEPESISGAVIGDADGSLHVASTLYPSDTEWYVQVEQRDARGLDALWSTDLTVEPQSDGFAGLHVFHLGLADDASVFMGGTHRLDFETHEPVVVKLAADGSLLWQRNVDTWRADYARAWGSIALDDGGVLMIAGRSYNSNGVIGNTPVHFTRLIRFDADGATVWEADPSEKGAFLRVYVAAIHAVGDRFALGGALVDDKGDAVPWLGYIDAQGELLCSTMADHPGGDPSTIDAFFTAEDGTLMAQGFSDGYEVDGSTASGRWIAEVYPY